MIIGSDRKTVRNNYPAVKDHKIFTAFWRHLSRAWYENIFQIYFRCQNVTEDSTMGATLSGIDEQVILKGKRRPLEKFWISYFNEVAGPGRVSRVPRGSDPCINCLRIELGERVCANGKIWIFLIMVLICSNSKSFRIGGREPLSEIRLKGFDILCWKIVPRRPFHCGGWTFGQFYNPSLRK